MRIFMSWRHTPYPTYVSDEESALASTCYAHFISAGFMMSPLYFQVFQASRGILNCSFEATRVMLCFGTDRGNDEHTAEPSIKATPWAHAQWGSAGQDDRSERCAARRNSSMVFSANRKATLLIIGKSEKGDERS